MKLEGWTILFGEHPEHEAIHSNLKSSLKDLDKLSTGWFKKSMVLSSSWLNPLILTAAFATFSAPIATNGLISLEETRTSGSHNHHQKAYAVIPGQNFEFDSPPPVRMMFCNIANTDCGEATAMISFIEEKTSSNN